MDQPFNVSKAFKRLRANEAKEVWDLIISGTKSFTPSVIKG